MKVAIVGASGAVGQELLSILAERNFPLDDLVLFGSSRSAGTKYNFRGKEYEVKLLQHNDDFKDVDIALTSAGGGTSLEFAETITKYGAVMIEELVEDGKVSTINKFPHQLAYNVIPQIDKMTPNDYTKEEMKMFNETQKIMHSDIRTSATCVRVSSLRSHSESVWFETEQPVSVEAIREALHKAPGVSVVDDPQNYVYPMPLESAGKDDVYVGRIRKDLADDLGNTLWLTGDQIRKGAALNAVQIAEYLVKKGDLKK